VSWSRAIGSNYGCPLLVCPDAPGDESTESPVEKELDMDAILVAVDGSPESCAAIEAAAEPARDERDRLVCVHVASVLGFALQVAAGEPPPVERSP